MTRSPIAGPRPSAQNRRNAYVRPAGAGWRASSRPGIRPSDFLVANSIVSSATLRRAKQSCASVPNRWLPWANPEASGRPISSSTGRAVSRKACCQLRHAAAVGSDPGSDPSSPLKASVSSKTAVRPPCERRRDAPRSGKGGLRERGRCTSAAALSRRSGSRRLAPTPAAARPDARQPSALATWPGSSLEQAHRLLRGAAKQANWTAV